MSLVTRNSVIRRAAERMVRARRKARKQQSPPPRSMRDILNDLQVAETEEGRLRLLEEMHQNEIVNVTRRNVAEVLRNIKEIHGQDALTDVQVIDALHDVLNKLKGMETAAAGTRRHRRRGRRGTRGRLSRKRHGTRGRRGNRGHRSRKRRR